MSCKTLIELMRHDGQGHKCSGVHLSGGFVSGGEEEDYSDSSCNHHEEKEEFEVSEDMMLIMKMKIMNVVKEEDKIKILNVVCLNMTLWSRMQMVGKLIICSSTQVDLRRRSKDFIFFVICIL